MKQRCGDSPVSPYTTLALFDYSLSSPLCLFIVSERQSLSHRPPLGYQTNCDRTPNNITAQQLDRPSPDDGWARSSPQRPQGSTSFDPFFGGKKKTAERRTHAQQGLLSVVVVVVVVFVVVVADVFAAVLCG